SQSGFSSGIRMIDRNFSASCRLLSAQGDAESAQSKWQEAEKLRTIMRMPELNPDWLAQNTG
ncbi:MAG: hypothetical protein AAFN11_01340, partial [Chloroflexota bacterium]